LENQLDVRKELYYIIKAAYILYNQTVQISHHKQIEIENNSYTRVQQNQDQQVTNEQQNRDKL